MYWLDEIRYRFKLWKCRRFGHKTVTRLYHSGTYPRIETIMFTYCARCDREWW